ncbi:MAG: DUF5683 domain-containing protein [Elusimicrobiota bacterium]
MTQDASPNSKAIIATLLSAFLGPGVGQFYNKQWKKGAILSSVALVLILAVAVVFIRAAKQTVSTIATANVETLSQPGIEMTLAKKILNDNKKALDAFKWTFLTLWCYSIVDAFVTAKSGKRE